MPVVGMIIKNIDAKRVEEVTGGIRVNNSTNLKDVKEQDLPAINKKGLSISFDFKAEYEDEKKKPIANITISGNVFYIDAEQNKILKDWKKDKKLPEDVNIQAINAVLRKCITKSIEISEDLQLPPPVPLPFATKQKKEEARYIG